MDSIDLKVDNQVLAKRMPGSIAENARKLGISRQHLNNILKGHRQPSADVLLRIQSLFKLSAKDLIKQN
jgi:transcriptional regulator with XRE-family HTH domain